MQRIDPEHGLLVAEGVVVLISRCAPSAAVLRHFEALIQSTAKVTADVVGLLHIAIDDHSQGPPDEPTRKEAAGLLSRCAPQIGAAGVVVLKEGFSGAALHAIFAGLLLLNREYPARVFANLTDVVPWLGTSLGKRKIPLHPPTLAKALEDARKSILAQ